MVSMIKDIDERAFIAQLASVFGRGKDELKIPAGMMTVRSLNLEESTL